MTPTGTRPSPSAFGPARRLALGACALVLAVGGWLLWCGLTVRQLNAGREWLAADAKVARGWVRPVVTHTAPSPGQHQRDQTFEVMVDYTFTAEGKAYNGRALAPRQIQEEEGQTAAQAIADSYAPGTPIQAYYHPGRPGESQLSRVEVATPGWLWKVVLGGILVLVGFLGVISVLRARRPRPPGTVPAGDE